MVYLLAHSNILTGAIPECFGELIRLKQVELGYNHLTGTIPPSFCQLQTLELLFLFHTSLEGTIPACFGTDFSRMQAMLLHDNNLQGSLPVVWSLPTLISLSLSNNHGLVGHLPSSLFLDSGPAVTSTTTAVTLLSATLNGNQNLRNVVIAGTRLSGTLPPQLCMARQLKTLTLSGTRFSGGLPECMTALQALVTFRAPSNRLTGNLPAAFGNMTALQVFDVSDNGISGRVPSSIGDISDQLTSVSLELNALSCDLPHSVLTWKKPAHRNSSADLTLLKGNLFGCGKGESVFDLEIKHAAGLQRADTREFNSLTVCLSAQFLIDLTFLFLLYLGFDTPLR
jgi:LRR receptor-like serine/threonine-protein kinase FLS2